MGFGDAIRGAASGLSRILTLFFFPQAPGVYTEGDNGRNSTFRRRPQKSGGPLPLYVGVEVSS
jgi:hypothetical protein